MSLYLSPEELVELTDKKTAPAQARRLKALGIPFIWQPGMRVKVLRSAVLPKGEAQPPIPEPDFSVFRRAA